MCISIPGLPVAEGREAGDLPNYPMVSPSFYDRPMATMAGPSAIDLTKSSVTISPSKNGSLPIGRSIELSTPLHSNQQIHNMMMFQQMSQALMAANNSQTTSVSTSHSTVGKPGFNYARPTMHQERRSPITHSPSLYSRNRWMNSSRTNSMNPRQTHNRAGRLDHHPTRSRGSGRNDTCQYCGKVIVCFHCNLTWYQSYHVQRGDSVVPKMFAFHCCTLVEQNC